MNKVKWSFSLMLALFIVGILSSAAFASDPYNLTVVQKDLGLAVSFTGNANDGGSTNFYLELKDGSTVIHTYTNISLSSSNQGTYTIPSADLSFGKVYTIGLYATGDATKKLLSESSTSVIDNQHNSKKMYQSPDSHVDVNGNGLLNKNETGLNNTSKSRDGQKVHGAYQNNTNSCASCHQTHTASDSQALLFKDGVYSTCSACHDGTTGAYNSFTPTSSKTTNSISGTFDVANDAHGSIHQADGSLKVASAPGGNNDTNSKVWNKSFDCASCHAPHGAGSADENNLNIDPMGWGGVQYYPVGATKADGSKATKDDANGKLFKNITIYNKADIPTDEITPYILVKSIATRDDVSADLPQNNYFWQRAGVTEGSNVIQTYRWDGNAYVADYSLWLREKGYPYMADTALYSDDWSKLSLTKDNHYNDSSKDITISSDIHVVWRDGFAWGPGVANVKSAQVSLGIDVETTGDVRSLYDPTYSNYIPDSGVEMTKYCSACHTDYMTDPATGIQGTLTGYHRHTNVKDGDGNIITIGVSDQFTCVRCHYAHGTKPSIMLNSNDNSATNESLSDDNHSSALRRYQNMDSCYNGGCHSSNSSDSLYLAGSDSSSSASPSIGMSAAISTSTGTSSTTNSGTDSSNTGSTTSSSTDSSNTGSTTSSSTDTSSTGSTTSSSTDTSTSSPTGSGTDTSTSSTTTGSGSGSGTSTSN